MYRIKDWTKFQHYKTGRGAPPWIKLYRDLLNDRDWFFLEPEAAKFLVSCWIIAAENDGVLPDIETLAFRYRVASKEIVKLLNLCNHWIIKDDSTLLAECYQDATPYTEAEKKEKNINSPKPVRTQYTESFEKFWSEYPTDKNMSKKEAFVVWKRLSPNDQERAIASLSGYRDYCRSHPDYRPKHAVGYLRGERWEGYLVSEKKPTAPRLKPIAEMTEEERTAFLTDFWKNKDAAE